MLSEEKITELIDQMSQGVKIEDINPKLELKRQWPDFNQANAIERRKKESEFLKDLVAMANTPGPAGYIIYGIGEDGNLYDGEFSSCNLTDQNQLRGLVVKRVSPPVTFSLNHLNISYNGELHILSVLEVPNSLEKPHVISSHISSTEKETVQYIPIRKNGTIESAGHYDIEYMIYDRKNIEPDYAIEIIAHEPGISFNDANKITMDLSLIIENYGRKPVGIVSSVLKLSEETQKGLAPDLYFNLVEYGDWNGRRFPIRAKYLVIGSNDLLPIQFRYELSRNLGSDQGFALEIFRELTEIKFTVSMESVTGRTFSSGILQGRGTYRR